LGETAPNRRRCRTTCGVTPNRAAISSAPNPRSSASFLNELIGGVHVLARDVLVEADFKGVVDRVESVRSS
jgi:hypothetical protein